VNASAAQATPAPSGCHALCLLPRLRSVRWSATPPGTAHGTSLCRRGSAPIRSALARHAVRPLRSRPASRARPGQTGGDPAAPGCTGVPSTSRSRWRQAAPARREGRGAPSPQQTEGRQRLGSFVASWGPHGPHLRETVGSPFVSQGVESPTVPPRVECPPRQGRRASLRGRRRLSAPPRGYAASRRRPLRRALRCPRPDNSVRCAHCAALRALPPTPRGVVSAPKSLRRHREPPGLRYAPALRAA
jgi:hypothetical protein